MHKTILALPIALVTSAAAYAQGRGGECSGPTCGIGTLIVLLVVIGLVAISAFGKMKGDEKNQQRGMLQLVAAAGAVAGTLYLFAAEAKILALIGAIALTVYFVTSSRKP